MADGPVGLVHTQNFRLPIRKAHLGTTSDTRLFSGEKRTSHFKRVKSVHTQFGHLAWIKTGLSNGNLVEVKSNLKPGEQIVTKAVYFLTAPHPGASAVVQK